MDTNNGLQVPQRSPGVQVPQSNMDTQIASAEGLQVPMTGARMKVPSVGEAGLKVPPVGGTGLKVPMKGAGLQAPVTKGGLQAPQSQFPAMNSPQRASSKAGGLKPRKQVALKPGRSLMDWVRIANQKGRVGMNGIGGKTLDVTVEELAKHNKLDDAWMSIRGKVYNVTAYMEYHPGGDDELMKGAGGDGTQLFNEVHQWVNVEGMLEKCYIGRLKKGIDMIDGKKKKLPQVTSSMLKPPQPVSLSLAPPEQQTVLKPKARYDWYQTDTEITVTIYAKCNTMTKDRVILDKQEKEFTATILLDDYAYKIHLELSEDICNNYQVRVRLGPVNRILIVMQKKTANTKWPSLGKPLQDNNTTVLIKEREPIFRSCKLLSSTPVTHDTHLFTFELPSGACMTIPIGYHVYLKIQCNGNEVNRPYTSVEPSLVSDVRSEDTDGCLVHLMIKLYSDGLLTQQIAKLKQGDSISISDYEGNFDESRLTRCSDLIMLAAGTGFTPMIRLIHWCLTKHKETKCKIKLLLFNKTEADIPWRSELQSLASTNSERFEVVHILSAPDDAWTGPSGRVRKELIDQYIPVSPKDSVDQRPLVCICGPTPFTNDTFRLIKSHGFSADSVHLFTA